MKLLNIAVDVTQCKGNKLFQSLDTAEQLTVKEKKTDLIYDKMGF